MFALPGGERFALAKGLGDSACKEGSLPCAMVVCWGRLLVIDCWVRWCLVIGVFSGETWMCFASFFLWVCVKWKHLIIDQNLIGK